MRIKQDLVPLPDNAIEVIDLFCYEEFSDSEDDEPEPEPELRIDFCTCYCTYCKTPWFLNGIFRFRSCL
ncbi:MAG: E7fs protein [Melanogrammus aeglefinus-associated papillomavirus 1]|uniref:E7fs protein n=1 Tax=Papillomaviridae sp. TaxID=2052558 RepID=A0A8F5XUV9_9PAPI|nr:MAG: E7fs protein [Melanogrammus aeglefinus-associated papillomavirus 1]